MTMLRDMSDVPLQFRPGLLAVGYTDAWLRRAERLGEVERVYVGSYLPSQAADEEHRHKLQVVAAAHRCPELVISHRSAAIIHGLPLWGPAAGQVEMTRNAVTGGYRTRGKRVVARKLRDHEVTMKDGMLVTTVAATLIDLGRRYPIDTVVCAADYALNRRLVVPAHVREILAESGQLWGISSARAALAFADGRAESVGESRSRLALARQRFPQPELQARIFNADEVLIAVTDFYWQQAATVGEMDGAMKYREHRDFASALMREKDREGKLRDLRHTVVRWGWKHLPELPDVAQQLKRAIASGIRDDAASRIIGHVELTPRLSI